MSDVKRKIAEASARARRTLYDLDATSLAELEVLYHEVLMLIRVDLQALAGPTGTVALEQLERLRERIGAELRLLAAEQQALLDAALRQAATLGAAGFAAASAEIQVDRLAVEAVRFVRGFVAEDGLTLSDRLWRLTEGTEKRILDVITQQVILGHDASRAADALLRFGSGLTPELIDQMGVHRVSALQTAVEDALMTGAMNPYDQARRLMRTELNRAHGEAYRAGMLSTPGVVGEKFTLSPMHRVVDECDFHAEANLYGLGAGVYPVGLSPWPAHPNTFSFLQPVFADEVSAADREGRSDGREVLDGLDDAALEAVLGNKDKAQAYREGKVGPQDVLTPWRELEGRL